MSQRNFVPKFFDTIKDYSKQRFIQDITAGAIVGIIAIPLAIAFAIASGVSPEKGLFTAVIAGFTISFLGGSRVQIGGPTGAFVVIVYGIVEKYGIDGLAVATFIAGFFLIIMGLARLGSVIKYIPHTVTVGFTSGIALIIFSSQIKDFFGLKIDKVPSDFIEKWASYFGHFSTVNLYTLGIAIGSLLIIVYWKKVTEKIPGSLIAIIVSTIVVKIFELPVETIGSKFGSIPSSLPSPMLPEISFEKIKELINPAFTIAVLAGIEALLSAVVADGMIGEKHRSNMELIANGAANILSPIFGGIPATGAIARTAANIKNGGNTPVAGMTHAIVIFLIMIFFGKFAELIPLATLSAILVVVAYNMSEWRSFVEILKSTRSDALVLITTFLLTVIIDLTVAIQIGMVLAVFLFMRRMSTVAGFNIIKEELKEDESDIFNIQTREIPKGVEVFEVEGALFFGAAQKFKEAMIQVENPPKVRIIRMDKVPVIDASGLHILKNFIEYSKNHGTSVIISELQNQPKSIISKSDIVEKTGEANIVENIDSAFERAKKIIGIKELSIVDRIKNGGIYYNIKGENNIELIKNIVPLLPVINKVPKEKILHSLIEREILMPTSVGKGIAIPYSRNPILHRPEDEIIAICFPEKPVDYPQIDEEKVHTLFVVLASNPKKHLEIIFNISKLCKDDNFLQLLKDRRPKEEIIRFIEDKVNK